MTFRRFTLAVVGLTVLMPFIVVAQGSLPAGVSLSPDDIRAAMRKHLDMTKMSLIKAGDFKKAAAAQ